MSSDQYKKTTANEIFKDAKHFRVKKDGVWLNALPDDGTPEAAFFQWHPLRPIYQRGGLDPKCNPSLPIPFTARELAAVFLDGAGALLASEQFGDWADGPDELRLDKFFDDSPKVKEVVRDAFDAYREALKIVGPFPISARQKREDARLAYRAAKAKDRNELDQTAIDRLLQRENVNQAEQAYGEACKAFEFEEAQWQKGMLLFLLHKHHVNQTEGGDTSYLDSKALLSVVSPLGRAGASELTLKAVPEMTFVTNKVPMPVLPKWRLQTILEIPPIPDCSWPGAELDVDPIALKLRQQSAAAAQSNIERRHSDAAPLQPVARGVVHTTKKARTSQLSAIIEQAKNRATDATDWASVWNALVALATADSRPPPLLGYAEGEGVKYQSDNERQPVAWLSREAFRKRARRAN